MTTVTLSFDLNDANCALAFRKCIGAEKLAESLFSYHHWVRFQEELAPRNEKVDISRVQAALDKELGKHLCNWVLKYPHAAERADAEWERPKGPAQVTVETGYPWEAVSRAQSLFARAVAHNQWLMSRVGDSGVSWPDIVQNLLAEPEKWFSERVQESYLEARGRREFFRAKQTQP